MFRWIVFMLALFSTHGFIMDDDETLAALEKSLRSSGFAWSRLTPALVVAVPHYAEHHNKTK